MAVEEIRLSSRHWAFVFRVQGGGWDTSSTLVDGVGCNEMSLFFTIYI
jgi:hypothetical protein